MSKYQKFSLESKLYGRGRRYAFLDDYHKNAYDLDKQMMADIMEVAGVHCEAFENAWLDGFDSIGSEINHNPLSLIKLELDGPPMVQRIKVVDPIVKEMYECIGQTPPRQVRGTVILYPKNKTLFIGYSLCNPLDKYNHSLGLCMALSRAVPVHKFDLNAIPTLRNQDITEQIRYTIAKVLGRGFCYYQQVIQPTNQTH